MQQGTQVVSGSVDIVLVPQYFFYNELIRVQVHNDGSLIFNCLDTYPGWGVYFGQIKHLVNLLLEHQVVTSFHRIGFRYISEFPNTDILENTNFAVNLSNLDEPITSGSFRVEWMEEPYRIIINLATKLPIEPLVVRLEEKAKFTSLIDIDVIHQKINESNPEQLFLKIDEVHQKEKEQFFKLLKPEFLETLNPEY